jgi:Heparan-alpha-glucosaminide N-acetyltransferase, catalytic
LLPLEAPTTPRRSEPGVDAWRAVVVVLMFVVHARRLQTARGAGLGDRVLDFCMWIEPYIAASFLFIAGASLVLSREKGGERWLSKIARRTAALFALSAFLFVPQYGLELPDLIVSSGILSAIALALIVCAVALESRRPDALLASVTAAVLVATFLLDRSGGTVPGLNAGPGGAFPLIAFTALGALALRARRRFPTRTTAVATLASFSACAAVLLYRVPWTTERASLYHAHAGDLALGTLLDSSGARVPEWFWNHSALGAVGLTFPLMLSLVAFTALGPLLGRAQSARPVLLLGRHALGAYVLHLVLLGLTDLAGWVPPDATRTWLLVAALTAAALVLAKVLESAAFKKAAAWRGTRPRGTPEPDRREARSPGRPA